MSSGGTASRLHSHEDHDLHCVLFGRKDFIIIDEKYRNNFNFVENVRGSKTINISLSERVIHAIWIYVIFLKKLRSLALRRKM